MASSNNLDALFADGELPFGHPGRRFDDKIINPRDLLRVFVVEPKQSFERIRAQEGAFIISAFHERFEREQIQDKVKNIPVYEYETIIVPSRRKERILKELNLLSFNREALYPSLGEVADRITQLYQ